ncbi:MAG: hypothetical protein HY646_14980 [Acidobacteria bacterium]|nr:hypothetical protein [Acidobacteriota bacterium]
MLPDVVENGGLHGRRFLFGGGLMHRFLIILFLPLLSFALVYSQDLASRPNDPVARLQQRIDSGEVKLQFDDRQGYLASLLKALEVPVSSQGLVFSKTSLQVDRIAPWTPRAVYFNENVYVGWVIGGPIIEIASMDPGQGAVFYTLDQQEIDKPAFRRDTTTCLMCHASTESTGGVPGLIVRSVYPDRYGYVIPNSDKGVTNDRVPLEDRWGGWYVTGTSGEQLHMGNMHATEPAQRIGNVQNFLAAMNLRPNANVTDLSSRFNVKPYLSSQSDIVGLLVLAHQAAIHNLITKTNVDSRKVAPENIDRVAERLVRAMLFSREAPLTGKITGTTTFASDFMKLGIRDRKGRSLRDLDVEHRLFRYPLSYLIYSDSFEALPMVAKEYVYRRLNEVLSGEDQTREFAHLSMADRTAILEILQDTKPEFRRVTRQ